MSKKQSKKVVATVVAAPAFNKKNAQAFGDFIFSNKHGVISCTKLCDGSLQAGKDGKRTMHCAVGEAFFTFVNPSLRRVLATNEYDSVYNTDERTVVSSEGSTAAAIDALVGVANLKDKSENGKQALAAALDSCVSSNDNGDSNDDDVLDYLQRARDVADTWNTQVVPLLK